MAAVKRLLLVCGMAALLVCSAASGGRSTPTLSSTSSPIVLDTQFQWAGCGYRAGALLRLEVSVPGGGEYEIVGADGCFTSGFWTASSESWVAGSVVASIYDASNTGGRSKGKELASLTVQVVGSTP